jgi:hypothetical protein
MRWMGSQGGPRQGTRSSKFEQGPGAIDQRELVLLELQSGLNIQPQLEHHQKIKK